MNKLLRNIIQYQLPKVHFKKVSHRNDMMEAIYICYIYVCVSQKVSFLHPHP